MGFLNLLWEAVVWIFQGIAPSERTIRLARALLRISFWLSPIFGIGFMLAGLHGQWPAGYFIAGIITILPVVVFEVLRRGSKVASSIAAELVGVAVTLHTWLAIINFWLGCLRPPPEYVVHVYGATAAITLFMVVMGRWNKPMRWYRVITATGLVLPAIYLVAVVIIGSLSTDMATGMQVQWRRSNQEAPKSQFGQRYDQNIQRVVEGGTGYQVVEHWYGNADGEDGIPVPVRLNELLWRTEAPHKRFPNDLYYAEFRRQTADRTMTPDPENVIWFPESKVVSAGQVETRKVVLASHTEYYNNDSVTNLPEPPDQIRHLTAEVTAEVTSIKTIADGQELTFARLYDRGQVYEVWLKI